MKFMNAIILRGCRGKLLILAAAVFIIPAVSLKAAHNFVGNGPTVMNFGVYEVGYQPDVLPEDPVLPAYTCIFKGPGESISTKVDCFGTGDGMIYARAYVNKVGRWEWSLVEAEEPGNEIARGSFQVSDSSLRGQLLPDPENPRHWMTENGQWFLNLNDTAYFLLSPVDNSGAPISEEQAHAYVEDAVGHGITSFRSFPPTGNLRLGPFMAGEPAYLNSVFGDLAFRQPNLANFAVADRRMQMLLNDFPDIYLQFVLLPLASEWAKDESFWFTIPEDKRTRMLRYVIARFAAYPQIFWLVENDAHYGEDFPQNNALAREVGKYLEANDPWQRPRSTGPSRGAYFPFAGESWATYIHLERSYDLNATAVDQYAEFGKPVFSGEDRYEQDRMTERDPIHMDYFQRRLFWAWLFSGASANYCGRWPYLHPYDQTGSIKAHSLWPAISGSEYDEAASVPPFEQPLNGLDSVVFIRDFFTDRQISLSSFLPAPSLVKNLSPVDIDAPPKLMKKGMDTWLVYHPNAAANGRAATVNDSECARFELDLSGTGETAYAGEWVNCSNGKAMPVEQPIIGGEKRTFVAPWQGTDVVFRLSRIQ